MSYRLMTKVTFTPEFAKMSDDEQNNELVATLEIVTRNGGTLEQTLVVPSEQCAYSIGVYPDPTSAAKAHIQIQARGAYELTPLPAYSLEEWQQLMAEARAEAVVGV
jgi:uncharacterized protein with GYD domain